ncbi:MAG: hypothetical protein ACOYM3_01810 [Terrimicrobiaceae bacterium]
MKISDPDSLTNHWCDRINDLLKRKRLPGRLIGAWSLVRRLLPVLLGVPAVLLAADQRFVLSDERVPLQLSASRESSGLAPSKRSDDRLWVENDSGNGPDLFLAGTDGSYVGTLHINHASNIDWEDLDSFVLDGKPFLLIADTGDNNARRESCQIYIVPEPAFPVKGQILDAEPAWTIRFRYEDGPRDCEAVAVDPVEKKILLLGKRTNPPGIYELPLIPKNPGQIQTARKIGTVRVERPLNAPLSPYGNQPTGLSLSPDGSLAAILTYYSVFLFPRSKGESWADAFARPPERLAPHGQAQGEAITFSNDGRTINVLSEGLLPPIISYRLR